MLITISGDRRGSGEDGDSRQEAVPLVRTVVTAAVPSGDSSGSGSGGLHSG